MEGKIPPALLEVLPAAFACRHKVVPLQLTDDILKVGLCQIDNEQLLSDLEFLTGKPVEAIALSADEMAEKLQEIYGAFDMASSSEALGEFQVVEKASEHAKDDKLRQESDELSVVALVNQIITNAIDSHASDIHIEAYEQHFRVRYRLDGVLQEVLQPPLERKAAIISRLKIMADLDIAEKRRPQACPAAGQGWQNSRQTRQPDHRHSRFDFANNIIATEKSFHFDI
jgi:type IV pilus assembly protein PilB